MSKWTEMFDVKEIPIQVWSILLAVIIAALRVVYDKEETSAVRVALEAFLCGLLAVAAGSAIQAMGLNQDWMLFAGGMIGFIGSQSIRTFAETFIRNKVKPTNE